MLPFVWVVVVVVVTVVVVLGDLVTGTFCVVVVEDKKNTITWYINTPDNLFMMAGLGYGTHNHITTTLFCDTVVQHVYDQQGKNGSPCWSYIKMHILFLLLIINPGQQMEQAVEQK